MKFCFGDIVVVEENLIGVIVKSWIHPTDKGKEFEYEVYVREYNFIQQYKEKEIERYMVRHKYLNDEEIEYQKNAILGWWYKWIKYVKNVQSNIPVKQQGKINVKVIRVGFKQRIMGR
mgnify:CR=1 FL=1